MHSSQPRIRSLTELYVRAQIVYFMMNRVDKLLLRRMMYITLFLQPVN